MTFLFDTCLSKGIVQGLLAFGEKEVQHMDDLSLPDRRDETWLRYAGERDMVALTKDDQIRYHPAAINEMRKYKVGVFILKGKKLRRWALILQVLNNWEKIKEISKNTKKPFCFKIRTRGKKFERIY